MPGTPPNRPSVFRTFLRYVVSLGVLAWIAVHVEWRQFSELDGLDWRLVVPAVLLAGAAYPLQAVRWHLLLRAQGVTLPPRRVHALFWLGNFYNSFLPGGVAGDAVRLARLWGELPERRAGVLASVLADRVIGLLVLLVLALAALGAHLATHSAPAGELRALLLASAATVLFGCGALAVLIRPALWHGPVVRLIGAARADALAAAVRALAQDHRTLAAAAGLSMLVWLLDFTAVWLLALAAGLFTGPFIMATAAAAAYVAASLPISIGGHGVREAALLLTLGWLGVTGGEAGLRLALVFWAVSTGWSLAGLAAPLWLRDVVQRTARNSAP